MKIEGTSAATVSLEATANGVDWRVIQTLMDLKREVLPVEILIAPGMTVEFGMRLANEGFISETHRLNTYKFDGVPVKEHRFLFGKHGVMRFSNGDVVPFFWGPPPPVS